MKSFNQFLFKTYLASIILYLLATVSLASNTCPLLFKDQLSTATSQQGFKPKSLQYTPLFSEKITNATNNYSFYAYHPTEVDRAGNKKIIGEIHYGLADNETVLEIDLVLISPEAKNNYIATTLYAKVLQEHPYIQEIKSQLVTDNYQAIKKYLHNGFSLEQAVRECPAYKTMSRLGFTEITYLHENSLVGYGGLGVDLHMRRSEQ